MVFLVVFDTRLLCTRNKTTTIGSSLSCILTEENRNRQQNVIVDYDDASQIVYQNRAFIFLLSSVFQKINLEKVLDFMKFHLFHGFFSSLHITDTFLKWYRPASHTSKIFIVKTLHGHKLIFITVIIFITVPSLSLLPLSLGNNTTGIFILTAAVKQNRLLQVDFIRCIFVFFLDKPATAAIFHIQKWHTTQNKCFGKIERAQPRVNHNERSSTT